MTCLKTVTKTCHFNVFNFLYLFSQVDKSYFLMAKFSDDGVLTSLKGQNNKHG